MAVLFEHGTSENEKYEAKPTQDGPILQSRAVYTDLGLALGKGDFVDNSLLTGFSWEV